ncbi:hypothetical protein [Bradyrhizobium erythrophlei]|uniref:Uncharacterized protein n=1 Tax=Bradyrhizobium erythrophlei TaxID=1437360 RepID=A0A1M5HJ45_9BRAD|nr:hypothetical protein [Bradyrhizobium erythrophlei]SHG15965.1 hypothetical protein SAMN05444169_0855 [Bradyrhizobium erythrophlei]
MVDYRTLARARELAAEARWQAKINGAIDAIAKVTKAAALVRKAEAEFAQAAGADATSSESWLLEERDQSIDPQGRDDVISALRDGGYSEHEIEAVLIALPQDVNAGNKSTEMAALVAEIRAVVSGEAIAATVADQSDSAKSEAKPSLQDKIPPQSVRILRDMPPCGATWTMKHKTIADRLSRYWDAAGEPYSGTHDSLIRAVKEAKRYRGDMEQ